MAPRERRLDLRLRRAQQIEGSIELVLIDRTQPEHGAERMHSTRLAQLARGRELGRRLEHPGDDQRQRQSGLALRALRQQAREAELAGHPEHHGDMAVRQRAQDLEALHRRREPLALEHPPQRLDLGVRPLREVGKGARGTLPPSR